MPAVTTTPKALRPYQSHGVLFAYEPGASEAVGECPLCGRERKWYVNVENGLWDCKVCGENGNLITFIRRLWDISYKNTPREAYNDLAQNRKLLYPETLEYWGACKSHLTGHWMIPGYNHEAKIVQMYVYRPGPEGRHLLLATADLPHGLFMPVGLYDPRKNNAEVAEGPWDGMALFEVFCGAKVSESKALTITANRTVSLISGSNVYAVPGANVFREEWCPFFSSKSTTLYYDSDHPRPHPKTGEPLTPVGLAGTLRAVEALGRAQGEPPASISYVKWGEHGYDPDRPSGFDVRDYLSADNNTSLSTRVKLLDQLFNLVTPVPANWIPFRPRLTTAGGNAALECIPCRSWREVIMAWKRSGIRVIPGFELALSVCYACCTTTESVGDQLWIKMVGPPSCGKSEICEALGTSVKYVYSKDIMSRLTSGYQSDRAGSENQSLAPKLKNKTLIIQDGDTLLQLPNRDQILSQLRAFYGRNIRSQYANKMSADHEGINATIIIAGTESLRLLDSSELGERLLDVEIVGQMEAPMEDEIALQKAYQAYRGMGIKADGRPDTRDVPAKIKAKQMTGGYLEYLREHAQELMANIKMDEWAFMKCRTLGTFVAHFRPKPSHRRRDDVVQRELSFRLVSQHVRLAVALAAVLNKEEVDEEVMRRVRQVSLATAGGITLDIARLIYRERVNDGAVIQSLAPWLMKSEDEIRKAIRLMRRLHIIEGKQCKGRAGVPNFLRWRFTDRIARIYEEVFDDSGPHSP